MSKVFFLFSILVQLNLFASNLCDNEIRALKNKMKEHFLKDVLLQMIESDSLKYYKCLDDICNKKY